MHLQKVGRMELDLREAYEALYKVQVDDSLIQSVKENYRNQLRYWSDMDLFKYHVIEEKIQLEITSLQKKAAEIYDPLLNENKASEELCQQIDRLQQQQA